MHWRRNINLNLKKIFLILSIFENKKKYLLEEIKEKFI
jgi:hypothetical protein